MQKIIFKYQIRDKNFISINKVILNNNFDAQIILNNHLT